MRAEGIGNKVFLITLLCAALGLFLYLRPRLFAPDPPPSLEDRLPSAEVIGRFYLTDMAAESSPFLYKYKVPFREYLTEDFILSQAKSFGLDLQKPGYFFAEDEQEWGAVVRLIDSSKVQNGFERLRQSVKIQDTVVFNTIVHKIPVLKAYLYYDKDYLFIYKGNRIKRRLGKLLFAEKDAIQPQWSRFLAHRTFEKESFVCYTENASMKKAGFDFGLLAYHADSANFKFKTLFHATRDLKIQLKDSGVAYFPTGNPSKMVHLHLDISNFKKDKQHPLYLLAANAGKRISFPIDAFFDAWDGDLCYLEGGYQLIDEQYIEMGFDEEFNPIEIEKTKKVPIKGFNVMMSVNKAGKTLVNKLFAKGIVNKQGNKYRFLFSPPVQLNILSNRISAYTSAMQPKVVTEKRNYAIWNYNGTRLYFSLDSLTKHEIYSSIDVRVEDWIKQMRFFK